MPKVVRNTAAMESGNWTYNNSEMGRGEKWEGRRRGQIKDANVTVQDNNNWIKFKSVVCDCGI